MGSWKNDSASVIFHLQKMYLQSITKGEDFENSGILFRFGNGFAHLIVLGEKYLWMTLRSL